MQCAHDLGDLADHEKRWCFSNSVAEQEDEPAAYAVQGDAGQLCLGANRLAAAVFGESQTSVCLYRPTQTYTGRQWFKHASCGRSKLSGVGLARFQLATP